MSSGKTDRGGPDPALQALSGKWLVIKYGGHAMDAAAGTGDLARDVVLLSQAGARPVIVHGGGPHLARMQTRMGLDVRHIGGLRVTDAETLSLAEMVLCGLVNKALSSAIARAGGKSVGLSGRDGGLVTATPHPLAELGFVGEPARVNLPFLEELAGHGFIPVIAPVGEDHTGQVRNMNADSVAGAIAGATAATAFLLMTDVPGVLDSSGAVIPLLPDTEALRLIREGVISGGMLPKLEACLGALRLGAEQARIVDGRPPGTLLGQLASPGDSGTTICRHGDAGPRCPPASGP